MKEYLVKVLALNQDGEYTIADEFFTKSRQEAYDTAKAIMNGEVEFYRGLRGVYCRVEEVE